MSTQSNNTRRERSAGWLWAMAVTVALVGIFGIAKSRRESSATMSSEEASPAPITQGSVGAAPTYDLSRPVAVSPQEVSVDPESVGISLKGGYAVRARVESVYPVRYNTESGEPPLMTDYADGAGFAKAIVRMYPMQLTVLESFRNESSAGGLLVAPIENEIGGVRIDDGRIQAGQEVIVFGSLLKPPVSPTPSFQFLIDEATRLSSGENVNYVPLRVSAIYVIEDNNMVRELATGTEYPIERTIASAVGRAP